MSSVLFMRAAAIVAVFGLVVGTAAGQKLKDGESDLANAARKTRLMQKALLSGELQADPKNKEHMLAIEHAAKSLVYPLHWASLGRSIKPKTMWEQIDFFSTYLNRMARAKSREQTRAAQQLFTRAVIDCCQEVIDEGKPIAGVNAARMMSVIVDRRSEGGDIEREKDWAGDVVPRLAEGNAEHLANTLITLLSHKKANDGVKYYLLRGLANLLALPPQDVPLLKKETEEKIAREALKIVERKVTFPRATPREEIEGYKVLRQQAVAVLANARTPSLTAKERPALALARVAVADPNIVPAPRLGERIEAIIGLARLTAKSKDADFQLDYAAEQVARGVLAFALEANKNLDSKVLDSKSDAATVARMRVWKVDAARLIEAVNLMRSSKVTYVQDVVREAVKALTPIENNSQSQAGDLSDWLAGNTAPAKSLFKGDETTAVKPAGEKE